MGASCNTPTLKNNNLYKKKIKDKDKKYKNKNLKEYADHEKVYNIPIKTSIEDIKKEKFKYKNKINLIYFTEREGVENLFGFEFVEKNSNNIDLIINGDKTQLSATYFLKEGENYITLIIKNKLVDLSYMFCNCFSLSNMEELRYLNTENVTNFSYIFANEKYIKPQNSNIKDFHSFLDINCLSTWNVSNGNNFESIFRDCHKLSNIKSLEKWNVSNGIIFTDMFCSCNSLSDLNPLKNWNVSKGKKFNNMFIWCDSLLDISPLKSWDVSNSETFYDMFYDCHKLSDINPLKNWNVSKCKDFSEMFYGCDKLSNIEPLKNWKVLKNAKFLGMFQRCNKLSNLNPIKKWNISEKIKKEMIESDD